MNKFYFATEGLSADKHFVCIESESMGHAVSLMDKLLPDAEYEPLSRKPKRAEFVAQAYYSASAVSFAAKPPKIKSNAGRPKGSCKPKHLRRVSHTITILPEAKARIKKLPKGALGREIEAKYCS